MRSILIMTGWPRVGCDGGCPRTRKDRVGRLARQARRVRDGNQGNRGVRAGPARLQDEKAIKLAADAFAKAYNAGDAKAIAGLFLASGEIVNEEGHSTRAVKRSSRNSPVSSRNIPGPTWIGHRVHPVHRLGHGHRGRNGDRDPWARRARPAQSLLGDLCQAGRQMADGQLAGPSR